MHHDDNHPFALADLAVLGFLRIVTHHLIYARPTSLETALAFVDGLIEQPTCVGVSAGANHWPIFRRVLAAADARANLVPDAQLAAVAIEHGATIATRDRGFARFADVRWLDPLDQG